MKAVGKYVREMDRQHSIGIVLNEWANGASIRITALGKSRIVKPWEIDINLTRDEVFYGKFEAVEGKNANI